MFGYTFARGRVFISAGEHHGSIIHGGDQQLMALLVHAKLLTMHTGSAVLLCIYTQFPRVFGNEPGAADHCRHKVVIHTEFLLGILRIEFYRHPVGAEGEFNEVRGNVGRDNLLQRFNILVILAVGIVRTGILQLFADIAGEVFVLYLNVPRQRILKAKAGCEDFLAHGILVLFQSISDEWNVNAAKLIDGHNHAILCIGRRRDTFCSQHAAREDAGFLDLNLYLAVNTLLFPVILNGCDGREVHIVAEEGNGSIAVQPVISLGKAVVSRVQFVNERL